MGLDWARAARCSTAPIWIGIVAVAASLGGCAARGEPGQDEFPDLAPFAGREVRDVRFVGAEPFSADTLEEIVETEPTGCRLLGLPFCLPGGIGRQERSLDLSVLRSDVDRLTLFYRRSGFFGTRVRPSVDPLDDDEVAVEFLISRGDSVILDTLIVEGTERIMDPDSLAATLPLQPGELFDLREFSASQDSIRRELQRRGYAFADVLRSYDTDQTENRATATLTAVPGPQVVIDSILVIGADDLGRGAVLRQLQFGQGDLLRSAELAESQRNLYRLELVQIATVSIAPDSLQLTPDDRSTATVAVRIAEAPVHVVEAAVGYGSVDCFRLRTRWISRSFAGGARRLELRGSASKIGSGAPLDFGLGESLCSELRTPFFDARLDYELAADFTQPGFLSPRNDLNLTAYAEQRTAPGIFRREARGAGIGLVRRLMARGVVLTAGVDIERGRTIASPALFCLALLVCSPADIAEIARPQWSNQLSGSALVDRTRPALNPNDGYRVRTTLDWATRLLASDVRFTRSLTEGTLYERVGRDWVAAYFARVGTFFGTADVEVFDPADGFLPPEERFFLGGATTVRGYRRNELGPGVYVALDAERDPDTGTLLLPEDSEVQFVPIGGTGAAVLSAELRLPYPRAWEPVRTAVFVDAGALDTDDIWNLGREDWRITPGVGIRLATPVGPARIDIAYNPHGLASGPLFLPDPETGDLIRVMDDFRIEPGSFLRRLRVHLAVGQAF